MDQRTIRKLGDPRVEMITVELTDAEVSEAGKAANALRDQLDTIKREKADAVAKFKARTQAIQSSEEDARRQVSTRRRDIEIAVQDYLTPQNEAVTVRSDTQDVINRRTATAEDLQESLFGGDEDEDESGFGRKPS